MRVPPRATDAFTALDNLRLSKPQICGYEKVIVGTAKRAFMCSMYREHLDRRIA